MVTELSFYIIRKHLSAHLRATGSDYIISNPSDTLHITSAIFHLTKEERKRGGVEKGGRRDTFVALDYAYIIIKKREDSSH